jgi:hypothetical protein
MRTDNALPLMYSDKVDGELLGMEDLQPVLPPHNQVAYIVTWKLRFKFPISLYWSWASPASSLSITIGRYNSCSCQSGKFCIK